MILDRATSAAIKKVMEAHAKELMKPGVLSVRPGFQMAGGWLTRKPAIVVTVARKTDAIPVRERLPETLGGFAVDVRQASPAKRIQVADPEEFAKTLRVTPPQDRPPVMPDEHVPRAGSLVPLKVPKARAPVKPQIPYSAPTGTGLDVIEEQMTITCHVSPDAGWPTLRSFLESTVEELSVGLYDFTSAHVLSTVTTSLASKKLNLVLDDPPRNPTADQTDPETADALRKGLDSNLAFAWALDRNDPFAASWIVPSAYHIKVAVKDHRSVWLSSGNWNNSNQPDIDPIRSKVDAKAAQGRDRDWHLVVDSPSLAGVFDAFLANDLRAASAHQRDGALLHPQPAQANASPPTLTPAFGQFFAPKSISGKIRIQPLLTPDPGVYTDGVLKLIQQAKRRVYFQNQYIHPSSKPEDGAFRALVQALVDQQKAGLDVRIILSEFETSAFLELLQSAGIDLSGVRIQNNVHNKGIVVDSSLVLVSSQNWSGDGVLRNRDAGVIVDNAEVAGYFEAVFIHDWTTLAHQSALD